MRAAMGADRASAASAASAHRSWQCSVSRAAGSGSSPEDSASEALVEEERLKGVERRCVRVGQLDRW